MISPKQACTAAAKIIDEHGHFKGGYGGPTIGFCAAGAIWFAITGKIRNRTAGTAAENLVFASALALLGENINGGIAAWNDHHGTSKEDVMRTLREAGK